MSSHQQTIGNKIRQRIRKETRYSSLTTMSKNLLKINHLYKQSKEIAKNLDIKNQKNYSIIALRLALLYGWLMRQQILTKDQIIQEIIGYMRIKLRSVLQKKYKKQKLLIEETFIYNMRQIEIFQKVLSTNLQKQSIRIHLEDLFIRENGQYLKKQQLNSLQRLTYIFSKFTNKQLQDYGEWKQGQDKLIIEQICAQQKEGIEKQTNSLELSQN